MISVISTRLPSQFLEVTYVISLLLLLQLVDKSSKLKPIIFDFSLTSGNKLLNGIKKAAKVNIAKGILLFVSLISSDTLILININIKRNNIDTAPTYTNKFYSYKN